MATVGGGAAYKGYQKIDDGLSQVLGKMTDIGAQKNAAKKLADERAGVRKEEADKAYSDSFDLNKDFKAVITSNKDYNGVITNYTKMTVDKATEFMKLGDEAQRAGNTALAREYQAKYKKSMGSFAMVNENSKLVQKKLDWYVENQGKMLKTDPRHKIFDGLIKNNYMLMPTDDGGFKMLVGLDKNKDGNIDDTEAAARDKYLRDGVVSEDMDIQEVGIEHLSAGGYDMFMETPILEKGGLIDTITSNVGLTTTDNLGEYKVTTTALSLKGEAALRKQIQLELAKPEVEANVMSRMANLDEKTGLLKDKYGKEDLKAAEDYLFGIAKEKYGFKQVTTEAPFKKSERIEALKNRNTGGRGTDKDKISVQKQSDGSYSVASDKFITRAYKPNLVSLDKENFKDKEGNFDEKAYKVEEEFQEMMGNLDDEEVKINNINVNPDTRKITLYLNNGVEKVLDQKFNTLAARNFGGYDTVDDFFKGVIEKGGGKTTDEGVLN
jgi:hypothetical protein